MFDPYDPKLQYRIHDLDSEIPEGKIGVLVLDREFSELAIQQFAKRIECDRCGKCCRNNTVGVFPLEVPRIASYLKIRPRRVKRQIMDAEEQLRMPCKLLVNGKCKVYPIRPIMCIAYPMIPVRGFSSTNLGVVLNCEASWKLARFLLKVQDDEKEWAQKAERILAEAKADD